LGRLFRFASPAHPTAEELNEYSLGRLDPMRAAVVEDHVQECSRCAEAVSKTPLDEFVQLLRFAVASDAGRSKPNESDPPIQDETRREPGDGSLTVAEVFSSPAVALPLLTLLASLLVLYLS
jgi:anti-sigma factor RsiW